MMDNKLCASKSAWTLTAGGVTASVLLEDGMLSLSASGAAGGMDFGWSPLGEVTVGGIRPRWSHLLEARTGDGPAHGRTLSIVLGDETGSLRMSNTVEIFGDHPFLRVRGEVENLGVASVTLDGCRLFRLAPRCPAPLTLFHVEQFSAVYRRDYFRPHEVRLTAGRAPHVLRMGSYPSQHWQPSSCAWFALLPEVPRGWYDGPTAPGEGLVCGLEFNGKSTLRAWADGAGGHVESEIDALAHTLAPGGRFQLPAVFLGRFEGDWDEAGYVTQRFCEAHVYPPMPDARYPWAQYNSWAYDQDINEAQQMKAIERSASLGLELVVLDLGWARHIGDWRPDPVKFPRGLRPLAERARALGMRFGVHVALAQCSLDAPVALEHPDWLVHTGVDYFGAAPLCLGHEPCRAWLADALSSLVETEGLDYIIQDGEDMVKSCPRTDHTHGPGDSNYSNSQYGLDWVIETLRARHPGLVLENCEDGGCMMTFRMARLYHTSITVDNIDSYSTRQGVFGASYPFSPRYSVRYMQDAPTRYTLYSSIFGGPLILMHRLTEWTDGQMAETRAAIALYKRLRAIIRDGKVFHLMRPEGNVPGGGWGWDAIQSVSADCDRGVAMVYRAAGGPAAMTIRPKGLDGEASYRLSSPEGGEARTIAGRELMDEGILVALPEFGAEIFLMERES